MSLNQFVVSELHDTWISCMEPFYDFCSFLYFLKHVPIYFSYSGETRQPRFSCEAPEMYGMGVIR